jgi:asparagine synthase (glutamine-hydrolysing)
MGVRRLAIIDIKDGQQPVWNEKQSIVATLNGELYNHIEIKGELKRAHSLNSKADTEIIPHLYEEHGEKFIKHINGMFGIALWDQKRQRLLLYRDRVGIKPLYYYKDRNCLIWGSELKSILASGLVDKKIDEKAVSLYFRLGYVPAPYSIFKGIKKLEPGHYLSVCGDRLENNVYWSTETYHNSNKKQLTTIRDAKEELLSLLEDSVKYRLISDVPIGSFLSGGIDSSLIVGIMSKLKNDKIDTFTAGFSEDQYDETKYANVVSQLFNTNQYTHIVHPEVQTIISDILPYFDEPFADKSSIPAYYVSKIARQDVTVALSGDGGDELFGGYLKYRTMKSADLYGQLNSNSQMIVNFLRNIPGKLGSRIQNAIFYGKLNPLKRFEVLSEIISVAETHKILKEKYWYDNRVSKIYEHILKSSPDESDFNLNDWMELDIKTFLVDDVLTKVDRMSMSHSLEVRVPFLDHRIVEFALRLPIKYKIRGFQSKLLLKKLAADFLPHDIVYRKKHSWKVPLSNWFKGQLSEYLYENICSSKSLSDVLNPNYIKSLILDHKIGKADHSSILWTTLAFTIWFERWYERK